MPGLYHRPIHRREFLRASILGGAAMLINGTRASSAASPEDEIHLVLLSDPHIGHGERAKDPRGFDPCAQLQRIVPDIVTSSPHGVIINGDAASREGLVEDYQVLKDLLEPVSKVTPVYIGFGNHDHRENFKQVFTAGTGVDAGVPNHQVLVMETPFLRFIVLDSLLYTSKAAGLLGGQQRTWLADYLEGHVDKPIIFFVHHTLGEGDGDLLDADRLFQIIRPYGQVKAIFYGHSHMWGMSERQGVKLINLPSIGYNFSKEEPVGWVDARFRRDGVDLTLHAIAGDLAKDKATTRLLWT
jgi:3',5'-cyclic AMP phosphodiesterase CpdA